MPVLSRAAAGLLALACGPAAAAELTPVQQVQLVQSALGVLGHLDAPVDGIDGRKTRDALAEAALALGWSRVPVDLDGRVADDISAAAGTRLAALVGAPLDGRWVLAGDDPIAALIACFDPDATAVVIEGLVAAFPATGETAVLVFADGRLLPLPPEGAPAQSEAHGFRLAGPDTLESLTEGDIAEWRRCPGG